MRNIAGQFARLTVVLARNRPDLNRIKIHVPFPANWLGQRPIINYSIGWNKSIVSPASGRSQGKDCQRQSHWQKQERVSRHLRDRQRWAQQLHPVSAPQLRVLGRHRVGPGHCAEKSLHLPCGQEGNQNAATRLPDKGPDMWNPPRGQQGLARLETETLRANLELKLAFEHIEPFILLIMQVTGRTALRLERVLEDQRIARVRRDHFEGNAANTQAALFAKAIRASSDVQYGRQISRSRFAHLSSCSSRKARVEPSRQHNCPRRLSQMGSSGHSSLCLKAGPPGRRW